MFIQRRHEDSESAPRILLELNAWPIIYLSMGANINSSNIMLSTAVARVIKYHQLLRLHEDWDFYIRLERHGINFVMIPEPLSITDDRAAIGRASAPQQAERLNGWRADEVRYRRALT